MNGDYQIRVETTIDEETEKRLQRYCTLHAVKKREAIRRAIDEMLASDKRRKLVIDPEVPL